MAKKRIKVSLVGPVAPYRGGIAKYNNNLIVALEKISDLSVVSFKHLYPKFLYPGGDTKGDPKTANSKYSYVISTYWPLTLNRAVRQIVEDDTDIAVITWWTLFWQPGMAYLARKLRKKGVKVIFLCHNLYDHDGNKLKQLLSKLFIKQASGYVVHDTEEQASLQADLPDKKVLMRNHPIYAFNSSSTKRFEKRGKLELLFFGIIRPYKGLDVLLEALSSLNDTGLYTTIAGEYWGDDTELLTNIESKNIPNIKTYLEYVSEEKASELFNRADVVVMPYLSATGSGVAALAFSSGKPIIASSVGCFKDVIDEAKTGWLVEPGSTVDLAKIISSLTRKDTQKTQKYIKKFCEENNWDNMAEEILGFADDLEG